VGLHRGFQQNLDTIREVGGNERIRSQMEEFQKTLEECELTDLGFYGPKYTWRNYREMEDFIKERLDRGVANQAWRDMFPFAKVQVEIVLWFDHSTIILHPTGIVRERHYGPNFRHEASWTLEEEYLDVIKQVWEQPISGVSHWDKLGVKLMGCRSAITQWQRNKKDPKYMGLKSKLLELQGRDELTNSKEERNVQKNLQLLLDRDDVRWRQRAKEIWLKNGDRNTKYFHACANAKRRKNSLYAITALEWWKWET
jgi:hypothetical protein